MKKIVALIVFTLIFSVVSSFAAGEYAKGRFGYWNPGESALKSGWLLSGAYGIPMQKQLQAPVDLELGVGYFFADFKGFNGDVDVLPLTATALYNIPDQNKEFDFYAGAGLGLYLWDAEYKVNVPFFGTQSVSDDGVALGVNLVGGAEYRMDPKYSLVGELQYLISNEDGVDGIFLNIGLKYDL